MQKVLSATVPVPAIKFFNDEEYSISETFLCDSTCTFCPTIPISATPSSTYPGISSSLRNKNSAGKFDEVAFNLPAPLSNLIPHSLNKLRESSLNRPDF